jgi:HSP20 family protein
MKRSPFSLVSELQRDMNRLFESRFGGSMFKDSLFPESFFSDNDWMPALDIEEQDACYLVSVDLPGINPEDIEITTQGQQLSIKGSRETVSEDKDLKRSERSFGAFVREFTLPANANLAAIEASSKHGVLEVRVPKAEGEEPRKITIKPQQ